MHVGFRFANFCNLYRVDALCQARSGEKALLDTNTVEGVVGAFFTLQHIPIIITVLLLCVAAYGVSFLVGDFLSGEAWQGLARKGIRANACIFFFFFACIISDRFWTAGAGLVSFRVLLLVRVQLLHRDTWGEVCMCVHLAKSIGCLKFLIFVVL